MNLPELQEVKPGVYQMGDDISLVVVTDKLILVGCNFERGANWREEVLGFLKTMWPDRQTQFLAFPTQGRSDFTALGQVQELRDLIIEVTSELIKTSFDQARLDIKENEWSAPPSTLTI